MVYAIYQVTESLTNYFDTYFSILVMNTIFFSSSKRKKNLAKIIDSVVKFGTISVGGCGGQPLCSKSILKVVSQMVRLCDYATVLFSYLHIGFLTFLALLKNTF